MTDAPAPPPAAARLHPARGAVRGPETWARIRDAFIGGETAGALASRFGVGESTVRTRARLEGWRRRDLAAGADAQLAAAAAGPPHDPADHAAQAVRRAAEEARFGRLDAAERWARVAERLAAAERALMAVAAARPDDLDAETGDALDAARDRMTARLEKLLADRGG